MVFSFEAQSQTKEDIKFIMIRQFKGQDQLGQSLSSALNKTVMKYLASRKGYELLLNSSAPPEQTTLNIFAVEGIVARENNTLNFTLDLFDIKKKVIVRTVKKTEIREEDFIRLIHGALEALFIPLKEQEIENKTQKKVTLNDKGINDPSIITNMASSSAIDFKQRIKGLQEAADQAINKNQTTNTNSEEIKSENNVSSSSSSGNLFSSSEIELNQKSEKTTLRVIKRDYNLELFYENRSIDTSSYIQTISQLNIFHLQTNANLWHDESKLLYFKFLFGAGKPLASELPAPNLLNLGIQTAVHFKENSIALGIKREDLLFFNIDEPGAGLKSGTIQANWAQILFDYNLNFKNQNWNIKAQYLSSISSSSGWKTLSKTKSFQGNSIRLEIGSPFKYFGFSPKLSYQQTEMVGKGATSLSMKDTRIALGATYFF